MTKNKIFWSNETKQILILKKLYHLVPHSGMEMIVKWYGHFSSCFKLADKNKDDSHESLAMFFGYFEYLDL